MKIGFLGLGRMGRELVQHVIAGGNDVTVWNRTKSATEDAAAAGAHVAENPAAAVAGAEVVVTMFFGPTVTSDVLTGPDADVTFEPGALWIDVTTVAPADASEFAEWAGARGIRFVSSPVIGSTGPAHEGTLGTLLGGAEADVAAARPIAELWSDPEKIRTFATQSAAATAKLIANLSVAVVAEGIAESLRVGHAGGMSTDEVLEVLPLTQFAGQAAMKKPIIAGQDWSKTQFAVDALVKDTGFMTALAGAGELPAVEAWAARLADAHDAGLGGADYIAALRDDV
ncbi:NAD(P)-dependent oxidoreductase [Gryllotalpicola reticulitermitis]|uniref:NAD(P)-dependent oxidoreductase n=1 Tax=Gryllotalpicola reticulitermitis TaxID=1184153 RepID=A0ABV8Q7T4_9MICO